MTRHRGTCEAPGCGRVWRENCGDCLTEVASRHQAETGHTVALAIVADDTPIWELRQRISRAREVLLGPRRGWR